MSEKDIKNETYRIIDFLSGYIGRDVMLPVEYIVFQKQVDFFFLDDLCFADRFFTIDEIDGLLRDIAAIVGDGFWPEENLPSPKKNRSTVHRNTALRWLIETTRPVTRTAGRVLPKLAKERLREMIYVPRDERMSELFRAEPVRSFVSEYYRDDIALWQNLSRSSAPAEYGVPYDGNTLQFADSVVRDRAPGVHGVDRLGRASKGFDQT